MGIFRILLPSTLNSILKLDTAKISSEVVIVLLIWVFMSLANTFYLRYVGLHDLTMFTTVKIILFSAFPSVILKIADVNKQLRDQLEHIVGKNVQLGKYALNGDMHERPPVRLESESRTDRLEAHPDDLMLVRSADNYISIVYKEEEKIRQKMLRNTITNIQSQLRVYPEFLRCHRTCIINSHYILNLTNSYKGYRLKLHGYEDEIPVSRQYILTIKEFMDSV